MKYLIAVIPVLLLLISGCTIKKPVASVTDVAEQEVTPIMDFSSQTTWLLGYFIPGQLTRQPHSFWYVKGFNDYKGNEDALNKLSGINKSGITIKIVLGTWCPDSRREVPRFMKVLDIWQFPSERLTFIGVDDAKLSPVGEYESLNIQRVPTFIIYKNNIEAGRIIENPVTSLEQDIVDILTRNE